MFGLFNIKRLLIEFAVVAALLGIGYWYFTYSQDRIAKLVADNASLTVAVDLQKKTIKSLQDFSAKQVVDIGNLQNSLAKAEEDRIQLENKLGKHDLESLSRAKPGLIEKRMNDASKKAIQDMIDSTTGK